MNFDKALKFFLPKDTTIFPMFEECAQNVVQASELLVSLMSENDEGKKQGIIWKIKDLEHNGDNISHNIYEHLNRTFITPFDREDIQELASKIDDVIDSIKGVAQKIELYKPNRVMPEFLEIAEIIKKAALEIDIAIKGLRNAGNNKKVILQACINLNTYENSADDIYHKGITILFENEKDAKELIKLKSILEILEKCSDKAEDVSDTIQGILVKMA